MEDRGIAQGALFAIGLVGTLAAVVLRRQSLSSRRRRYIKAVVYHAPEDAYFRDFRAGVERACYENEVMLDYQIKAETAADAGMSVMDELAWPSERRPDGLIVRLPNAAADALVRQAGVPFVSVLSDYLDRSNPYLVSVAGQEATSFKPGDLVVASDDRFAGRGRSGAAVVLLSSVERLLEDLDAVADKDKRVFLTSTLVETKQTLDLVHAMGFRSVHLLHPRGRIQGARAVEMLLAETRRSTAPTNSSIEPLFSRT